MQTFLVPIGILLVGWALAHRFYRESARFPLTDGWTHRHHRAYALYACTLAATIAGVLAWYFPRANLFPELFALIAIAMLPLGAFLLWQALHHFRAMVRKRSPR